jgi:hypothetical protein
MIYTIAGDDPWEPQLTPGADLAKRKGCTCSRLDNKWGEGRPIVIPGEDYGNGVVSQDETEWEFFITPNCPLHDTSRVESAEHPEERRASDLNESSSELARPDEVDHKWARLPLELDR